MYCIFTRWRTHVEHTCDFANRSKYSLAFEFRLYIWIIFSCTCAANAINLRSLGGDSIGRAFPKIIYFGVPFIRKYLILVFLFFKMLAAISPPGCVFFFSGGHKREVCASCSFSAVVHTLLCLPFIPPLSLFVLFSMRIYWFYLGLCEKSSLCRWLN